jgi:PAS domain S-box-containing protein
MTSRTVPGRPRDDGREFQLLAQALTDYAIYMLDSDGFITSWNAGAARIKGYDAAEIIGQHFSRFFTEEDQRAGLPRRILELARSTGRYESEGWRVRKDGKRFWAVAVIEAIRDEAGELVGFGKVTRDITDRYEARQALVESERRFRLLVESVLDYAIFMLDPSGIVTHWNPGATRIKGYTAEEILGSHFSRFYAPQDRAKGLPAIALETARREGKFETEGWRVRKDGGHFWASVVIEPMRGETGELIGFANVTRDITERRSAQEALKESERQFRLLVSAVVDYALYMLDPNGVVVNWNSGAEKIKGYSAEEIIGSHFSKFYAQEDREAGLPTRALHTAATEGRFEEEGWRVCKDGSKFWASVVIDAIRDENKRLVGFAKITQDITERRQAQIAIQQAQEQLSHAQKMEALGQLTGGIAHDFNNLLTIIAGQARVLKKFAVEPKAVQAAEAIDLTVQRGAALTRQLLGFSRKQTLDPQPVFLVDRIPGLQTMLSPSLPTNFQLINGVLAGTWAVLADAGELDLAIMNLILNARDAMPSGGTITITAENVPPPHKQAELEGDFVALSIIDTGMGIGQDVLPRVFDPFFTTKRTGRGTGLGLSQVHGFAHQSGGTVEIDSEIGKGTRVTMYLPRAAATSQQRRKPETEKEPVGRRHARILVVEDNPDVTEVTSAFVKELGYTIRVAPDAEQALRILENEAFDLVFADIRMPGAMDGLGLGRTIRAQRPWLPVLLASGSTELIVEAQKEFPALQKPYDISQLDRAIQALLWDSTLAGSEGKLVDLHSVKRARASKAEKL